MAPVLEVSGLSTVFHTRRGLVRAVQDVSFAVNAGETLAIVGESGCGKTITALSLMRLVPMPPGEIAAGSVKVDGTDLLKLSDNEMRSMRGSKIAMIFQEPMTALNPLLTVGNQIEEMVVLHDRCSREVARKRAVEMLHHVRIPEPDRRAREYPHQLSGGMRQRAMIAMALACRPKVLVADGEAAVIGGLTVTETTRFRSGIPVLMNLPFIGRLFSQNSKNETKRDLLILVTPHILEDGAAPPPGR